METQTTSRFKGSDNAPDLQMFIGTENYYKCMTMVYTDGVKHLCDSRQCYWLLTDIALTTSFILTLKSEPFLTCEFTKTENGAMLTYTDGNNNILHTHPYEYTDFSDDGVCLYFIEGVLLLPSEY